MTHEQIQAIFQQRYNHNNWKQFLGQTFSNARLLSNPEELTGINKDVAIEAFKIGYILLDEEGIERQVAIYEVVLAKGIVLERNRVGLRNLLRKYWKNIDAAFIAYYNTENTNWRFTYVSELTGFDTDGELISIKTEPKRYTYILGEGETCRTAAERFAILINKGSKVTLDDIKEAFSVEKLSKSFFDEYKYQYEDFVEFLTGKRIVKKEGKWQEIKVCKASPQLDFIFNGDEKAARDFCKKLLGRIVFLYFIQKKGWLGVPLGSVWGQGDKNFIYNLFEKCQNKELFYPEYLTKLFFDSLNTHRKDDLTEFGNVEPCRIPYLNGGLFEEENSKHRSLIFPSRLFQSLISFFNQYNFTIYEDDPNDHTIAVGPEMLGHIFENLLEDNKEKGAYYTPKEIVHFMCQESLIEYLTTWFEKRGYEITGYVGFNKPDQIQLFSVNDGRKGQMILEHKNIDNTQNIISRKLIEKLLQKKLDESDKVSILKHHSEFQQALDDVKICDPAIGSGAFPMGLLHEIFTTKQTLYTFKHGNTSGFNASTVKLNIIQNSIYGVDIEKGAVDIARLRFWLSLIVDENEPQALPNLNYKIVVGNSLVSKLNDDIIEIDWSLSDTSHGLFGQDLAYKKTGILTNICKKQKDYFNPESNKTQLGIDIRNLKIDLLVTQLELMVKTTQQESAPIITSFKDSSKFLKATEKYHQTLGWKKQIEKLKLLKVKSNDPLNFFNWKLDFPEVMNEQVSSRLGFDIVIANPPYMRVQEIQRTLPEEKKYIEGKFKCAKASYDLANVFFELAILLSNENANNAFIFPHKFFNSASTAVFRDYLMNGKFIDKISHFGANMVFNEADTYTCITFFSPKKNTGFWIQKFALGVDFKNLMRQYERYSFIDYTTLENASKLYGSNQWIFFNTAKEYQIFEKLYSCKTHLSDFFEDIFQGIATSNDNLFILDVEKESNGYLHGTILKGTQNVVVEKCFFKPLLKGKDVQRYSNLLTDNYVFFPYRITNDIPEVVELEELKNNFPKTYDYVINNEELFKKRERGKARKMKHWYAYIYPKNLTKFEQIKLSSMEICANHPNVTLNDKFLYHNTKVYSWVKKNSVKESYEYFLAIANSYLLWWFLKNTGDTLQGDARTFKTNYLNPFPIPRAGISSLEANLIKLSQEVMIMKREKHDSKHSVCYMLTAA